MEEPGIETKLLGSKSKLSKIPLILLILSFILLIICLIILIAILTQIKKENEKEETPTTPKTTGKTPIIGITGMRVPDGNETINMTETPFTSDMVQIHYIEAIEKAGGIPMGMPVLQELNVETIKKQIESVDGILIQGGLDVDPSFYNEERHPLLGQTNVQTDKYLIEVIKQAIGTKIPILGICRGHQILNVALGGNLYQDLSVVGKNVSYHRQDSSELCHIKHSINVNKNSLLSKIFPNNETLQINSLHHQAINKLGTNLEIDAKADDDIIEAIHYKSEEQWVLGVQFHPEQLIRCEGKEHIEIFKKFIEEAQKYKDNK